MGPIHPVWGNGCNISSAIRMSCPNACKEQVVEDAITAGNHNITLKRRDAVDSAATLNDLNRMAKQKIFNLCSCMP